MIYIRGFDLRSVPVLIDGIPVYVPYDGYVDLSRFLYFDLAEVQIAKGYTSAVFHRRPPPCLAGQTAIAMI